MRGIHLMIERGAGVCVCVMWYVIKRECKKKLKKIVVVIQRLNKEQSKSQQVNRGRLNVYHGHRIHVPSEFSNIWGARLGAVVLILIFGMASAHD
jgi:hypothetical protein